MIYLFTITLDGERTKRYAEEMKSSLRHFDERMVLPRLENLMQRSRWKDRYKVGMNVALFCV